MKAPKCKICGNQHWNNESCTVPMTVSRIKKSDLERPFVETKLKFDKTAYQREYMRKRRAK